jgi:HK97 family phage major capsid protein
MAPTVAQLIDRATEDRREAERNVSAATTQIERIMTLGRAQDGELSDDQGRQIDALAGSKRDAAAAVSRADAELAVLRELEAEQRTDRAAQADVRPTPAAARAGGASGEYRTGDERRSAAPARSAAQWMREDGRPAALERASRTQDHPVAAEQIEKDPVRHIAESYSGIGALVRSLSTTSASALVPQIWSSSIIDIARRQAQVINAGAEVVPMDGKTLNIGRALTDPPSAWVAEGGTRTAADPSYDLITLTTSTMYCFTTVTLEWLADAPNADSILEEQIGKSMALELDLSALFGGAITGVDGVAAAALGAQASPPGPRGILGDLLANYPAGVLGNATNGTVQVVAGYWREVLQAYYLTRANNESPTALIWPSKLAAQYAGLVDTLGQPLRRPDALAQLQFLESQQIPANLTQGTGTNMADFVLGDFRQVILGQRLSMTLQVLTERYAEAGMIGLLMTYRGDIRLARPKAMAWWRFLQGVA